jgi:hypothetical protein
VVAEADMSLDERDSNASSSTFYASSLEVDDRGEEIVVTTQLSSSAGEQMGMITDFDPTYIANLTSRRNKSGKKMLVRIERVDVMCYGHLIKGVWE